MGLVVLENIAALLLELVVGQYHSLSPLPHLTTPGGLKLPAKVYYSWDIRLSGLGLAVIFLVAYYYR